MSAPYISSVEVLVDTAVRITADDGEQLWHLQAWLADEDGLRGRVTAYPRAAEPGNLGIDVDALLAVLAPGGVAVTLVGGLFAWLRSRTSPVRLRLARPDGSEVELECDVAGRISAAQLSEVVEGLATWVDGGRLGPDAARILPYTPPADQPVSEADNA